jgi:hypothetical protein
MARIKGRVPLPPPAHARHAVARGCRLPINWIMAHIPEPSVSETVKKLTPDPSHRWTGWVAVSTAVLAAFAAISSLISGYHTDEAMIEQIRAADQWAFFQAKSIKAAVLDSKMELLPALGKPVAEEDAKKAAEYESDKQKTSAQAKGCESRADDHRHRRAVLARASSGFQIAIALCAITLLTKRPPFWWLALAFGGAGLVFLLQGTLLG